MWTFRTLHLPLFSVDTISWMHVGYVATLILVVGGLLGALVAAF